MFGVPIFPREISRNFPRKNPTKIGGMKGWVITAVGAWGLLESSQFLAGEGPRVAATQRCRRKNSDGTTGVLRVVKDGSWQVIFLFGGGGGYGVVCLYHVFFWLFFGDLSKRLLGITMKLIRVSPY